MSSAQQQSNDIYKINVSNSSLNMIEKAIGAPMAFSIMLRELLDTLIL